MSKIDPDKVFLRPSDICKLLGISQPTLYRWIRIGHFPKPVKYGPLLTGWRPETIDFWVSGKVDGGS